MEEPRQHALLEALGDSGPIPAHGFEPDDFQPPVFGISHPARIALLAALLASAHPGEEKACEDFLEFKVELSLDVVFGPDPVGDFLGHGLAQLLGVGRPLLAASSFGELDKNRIGVSVEHLHPPGFKTFARPGQGLLAKAGNRIGEFGTEKTASRGSKDSEHRIHHDLDGLVGVAIPALLGGFAPLHESLENPREDGLLARESRAVRSHDGGAGDIEGASGQSQGVDIESPHEARIKALEVVDGHVAGQPGDGVKYAASGDLGGLLLGFDVGGHCAVATQFG